MAMQENIQYIPNFTTPCAQGTYRRAKVLTEHQPAHPSRRSPPVQFLDCLDRVPGPIKTTCSTHRLSFPTPERQSGHRSSMHLVSPSVTNLGMLCKYRRRRTSSVVLQWGFNQAVFLVVIMATARPDLSLVPVKRGGK